MKTIYLNSENKATLVCPQCEKAKIIDAGKYLQKEGPIKIKFTFKCRHCYCGEEHAVDCDGTDCRQGHTIAALLERRRYYRKNVNLNGKIKDERGMESPVKVLDISKKGLLLKLIRQGKYEVGDILTVLFELDDPQRSKINKEVVIRKMIAPDQLGVEFTTRADTYSHSDKAIGFYLMN
jgi:hypothetical protein